MKVYAKILLVSLLLLSPVKTYAQDMTHVDLMSKVLNSTVLVRVEKDNQSHGHGSATRRKEKCFCLIRSFRLRRKPHRPLAGLDHNK